MGFDRRFTAGLLAWIAAQLVAICALVATLQSDHLAATRLLAAAAVAAALFGLWRHIARTNVMIAGFLDALRHGDMAVRFDKRGGAGFDRLAGALNESIKALQTERDTNARELRYLEALIDDAPVALLAVETERGVRPLNKAARRLFDRHHGVRPEDYAIYGATFASRLVAPASGTSDLLILKTRFGLQRAIIRVATLERLGMPIRAVMIEPVQGTLDTVEVAAQTDLVRVLTHEILNSLTPVMSLSASAADLLAADPPDLAAARTAVETVARRTQGLRTFIDRYRSIAVPPVPRPRDIDPHAFAREMETLFRAEWPGHRFILEIDRGLRLQADGDLLAQAVMNLLKNAAHAAARNGPDPHVRLALIVRDGRALIEIEDNGPGVPEEFHSDVFLPFFTTRADGTGIGLALVRQIVVASGWSIEIDTGQWSGALFRVLM